MWPLTSSSWKAIAQTKRDRRDTALESAPDVQESFDVYTKASATEIVTRIKRGEWTASEVLEAYISRSVLAHETTNCITEVLYEEARKIAQELDQYFLNTHELKGPLHGVPVSFKDLYNVQGYDSTMGYTKYADQPARSDAEVVALVRHAGGIPFVKTNVPQTMFIFECINPLWGRTTNPYSAGHSPGGSSGGEAALLAMDGAALGWGSDIGGSLRMPASYCGIYSLKPGFGRVPLVGAGTNFPGLYDIPSVLGPMARTVEDVELASRIVFGQESENYDPAPIPYRDVTLPQKLKFGFYVEDGIVQTSPACKRAVLETIAALRAAGHECVEFVPPDVIENIKEYVAVTSADGTKTLLDPLGDDPEVVEISGVTAAKYPSFIRWFATWVVGKLFGDPTFQDVFKHASPKSTNDYWGHVERVKQLIRNFNNEVWKKHGFDGVICPVQASPPIPNGSVVYLAGIACMTTYYNVIDSPIGTVPVTRVDPKIDGITEEYTSESAKSVGSSFINYWLYRKKEPFYDAEKMKGLPVGIQIVGKKWEDEKVVEMMKLVDGLLGQRGFGPGAWDNHRSADSSK